MNDFGLIFSWFAQTSDILYFETLDLPLPELQGLKTLKVAFHNAKTEEVGSLICRFSRHLKA